MSLCVVVCHGVMCCCCIMLLMSCRCRVYDTVESRWKGWVVVCRLELKEGMGGGGVEVGERGCAEESLDGGS